MQGILALVAYKVTTKSLTLSMEHISVPVRTFEAIALQDSTFTAFFKQVGNFLSIKGWGHKIRILWIIISTLFIVAFPSLASAMTGYAPLTKPFVQGKDGLQFPLTSYRQVIYVVHDADRLGLQSPLILTSVPKNSSGK